MEQLEEVKIWKNCGRKMKSLIGLRFGKLIVLSFSHREFKSNRSQLYWNCLCDCGNNCIRHGASMKNGNTTSCGCIRGEFEDLIRKRFGKLLVLEFLYVKNRQPHWKCKCDCGKEKILTTRVLKFRNTTSCGCYHHQWLRPNKHTNRVLYLENCVYSALKRRNKRLGFMDTIDFSTFKKLIYQNCHYCNSSEKLNLYNDNKTKSGITLSCNGIDRIDSSKGYTLENSVPCCKICNRAKNDLSQLEFYEWIKKLHVNLHNKELI